MSGRWIGHLAKHRLATWAGSGLAISAFLVVLAFVPLSRAIAEPAPRSASGNGPCTLPDTLSKAKEDKEARKAYVAVLKNNPTAKCALDGLAKLNAPAAKSAKEACELGQAYLDVHRHADAAEAFKSGLEKDPQAECAKNGLEKAGPSWFTRTADTVANSIPTVLIFIGLGLLVVFAFLLLGYWPWMKRQIRRPPVLGPLVSRVLGPRLTFESVEDKAVDGSPGGPFAARIKERLSSMRDEALSRQAPEYSLDIGTPREEFADLVSKDGGLKNSLDNASDISDQAKVVAALLSLVYSLLPIRRFEISGSLEPPASTGVAATVLLERDSKLAAATTLRAPQKASGTPTAPDYMQLADSAAVWIQHEVARSLDNREPDPGAAESQALVREGLDFYGQEELEKARTCYEKALELNRRNWAAYVCLAVAEARSGQNFGRSIRKSEEGLGLIRGEANP